MVHVIIVGLLTLFVITLFARQIVDQLRSGKMRPRGSEVYKTRQDNPVWYWSSIGVQLVVILTAVFVFGLTVLKATK